MRQVKSPGTSNESRGFFCRSRASAAAGPSEPNSPRSTPQVIVVMKKDAKGQDVSRLVEHVESLGLKAHVIVGTERTVVAVVGDDRKTHKESLESCPGVAEVVPILAPYKVASLEVKSEPTVVRAGSLTVGGGTIGVIAGPCSVESEAQIMASAKAVKAAGATALRGGAFKPRTS